MRLSNYSNIVLIGMPGSGKSTLGVLLAKERVLNFVDTDVLIQSSQNCSLQSIVDSQGHEILKQIEEQVIVDTQFNGYVIATGGSAVYSSKAMEHLASNSLLVFLDVSLETLKVRIHNFTTRGLAKRPDQSFEELFEERFKLYEKYADLTISCDGISVDDARESIIKKLNDFDHSLKLA